MKLNKDAESWARVKPDAFLTGSIVQARNVIEMALQDIAALHAEVEALKADRDRTARNRDMWKGQCDRQAAALRLRATTI